VWGFCGRTGDIQGIGEGAPVWDWCDFILYIFWIWRRGERIIFIDLNLGYYIFISFLLLCAPTTCVGWAYKRPYLVTERVYDFALNLTSSTSHGHRRASLRFFFTFVWWHLGRETGTRRDERGKEVET
jgi:hypothetical protein